VLEGPQFGCAGVRRGLLLLLASCAAPDPTRPDVPPLTDTARVTALQSDHACARCHAQIAAEWSRSEHHASDDQTFRASLGREHAPEFCQGCHAPLGTEPSPAGELGVGVTCSNCHADIRLGPLGHPRAPQVSAERASRVCAKCHEFAFPGPRQHPEKLQLTISEHAASPFANTPCMSCHMPRIAEASGAHASHSFAEARSESTLRAALSVESQRVTPTRVRLTLRSQHVGHAFPTGDLFRRLVIEADVLGPDYAVISHQQRQLARHFGSLPAAHDASERVAIADDRVLAGAPSVTELDLGDAALGRPIGWRVRYERVLHLNPVHEEDATIESSLVLASGTLSENP
jgi:hypothetical protein